MLLDSIANPTSVNLSFNGQRNLLCPFHIFLTFDSKELKRIHLKESDELRLTFLGEVSDESLIISWFQGFFQGVNSPFPIQLNVKSPPFANRVLEELQRVPFGETVSYKELAKRADRPLAARAVGNICNANPFPLVIPCHRVVRTSGESGGFAYGNEMKEALLNFERCFPKR